MTTRDIADSFKEMYGADVSHSLISRVTEAVIDEVNVMEYAEILCKEINIVFIMSQGVSIFFAKDVQETFYVLLFTPFPG